jgi:hypothetical protein
MPVEPSEFLLAQQSPMLQGLFLLHLLSAAFLCGLIWFVQVVHYPLFSRTGFVEFSDYHRRHMKLTGLVVGPPMLFEVITALAIVYLAPGILMVWPFSVALILLGVIWVSTAVVLMPLHRSLRHDFSRSTVKSLVAGNWIRTIAWSARMLLLAFLLVESIK